MSITILSYISECSTAGRILKGGLFYLEKIKRFIECLVPVTVCNLKCSYCYVIQEERRTEKFPDFQYSAEHIGKALSKERLGGICYISICGAGETLVPKEMTDIIQYILEQGHYVNITTNGTLTKRFDEIVALPKALLRRLHFSFSFHYLELLKINKIDDFFANIQRVKDTGCSFLVQFNLCDEYVPYLEEIKSICEKNVGAAPQVAATRNELTNKITLMTTLTNDEYKQLGDVFKSPLFDFTMKNFMVKRKEFCYAGDWSALLNLSTGDMMKCYASDTTRNIFMDLSTPIKFKAVGNNCSASYCVNSSHFMSLGVIPSISTPSYSGLRDRIQAGWYTPQMRGFLSGKLCESNTEYNKVRKLLENITEYFGWNVRRNINRAKKLLLIIFR